MVFLYKAKILRTAIILSSFPTYSILLSTIFDGPPLSPERETCCMLLFVQLSHSCLLSRGTSSTCYRYSYILTYRILLSPTSERLAVRPFSPERETFEPLPLSIQIHSVRLRCLFSPRYLYLHQKMYIYYFMLYLAESLTGRSYTEGKLLRYFPLWRERGNDDKVLSSLAVSP